ncbi:MAG TPA: tRNA (adenosine(37)-N6)-threonylcarbamoyltransferase complex dimerization subunit type 1 TsaB [Chthoniobacterales bacterium]|jgi:tRNA threonylcarbamoyl adenosine modification protein YeaZ
MKILALELSTARAGLAWSADGATADFQSVEWPNDRKDSGPFFENLQKIVQQFGLPERIIVGLGPGSYAGVRIAISTAVGLGAASAAAELIGYPSVCAISSQTPDYAVIGDARRRSFFLARVCNRTLVGDYELLCETELKKRIEQLEPGLPVFSSDQFSQFQGRLEQRYPSAKILGQLGCETEREFCRPPLEPVYLREANVTIPKPVGMIR